MKKIFYEYTENGADKIKVVLQFLNVPQDIVNIQNEVKELLFYELKQQMDHEEIRYEKSENIAES